jgi:hypothetical protein
VLTNLYLLGPWKIIPGKADFTHGWPRGGDVNIG